MDSMPPATTTSNSPARINWSARAMASMPDRHTLLIVSAGVVIGMPAATAAWRAVICPVPACSTCPMITYCTWSGATPDRSRAALIASPPRAVAGRVLRLPSRRPMGVRAPLTITEVVTKGPVPTKRWLGKTSRMTDALAQVGLLRIDHVGIAVADMDKALRFYAETFGLRCVHEETNPEQGVREAMLAVGPDPGGPRIQLLAPAGPDSAIAKFLDRSGPWLHQVCDTGRGVAGT